MELPDEPLDDPFRGPNAKLLTIRVPDTLYDALERTAKKEKIPLSIVVRGALYLQLGPELLEGHLKLIGEQYQGEEALEKLGIFRAWLDENRENLAKLLISYRTLRRGEAFVLELEEKLQQLEKKFATQVKEEMADVLTGLLQPKSKKPSKKKNPRKEKTA